MFSPCCGYAIHKIPISAIMSNYVSAYLVCTGPRIKTNGEINRVGCAEYLPRQVSGCASCGYVPANVG